MFDNAVLRDYVRNDAYDVTVMQEIFAGEQKQNEGDGATAVAMTEMYDLKLLAISWELGLITSRFYRLIQGIKCKKFSCNGVPVLHALKEVNSIASIIHYFLTFS